MSICSWTELTGRPLVSELRPGMDFRAPELRKEVFMRLYEFHTSLGIQPGLVYLFLPALAESENWSMEQRLWVAFLEGCCENPCTVWAITRFFPEIPSSLSEFEKWHSKNWTLLDYDIDTRYNKGHLVKQLTNYLEHLGDSTQEEVFGSQLYHEDPKKWFDNIYTFVTSLYKFGRMTSWSYIEFIKILSEYPFEFSSFHMDEIDGSKSQRNGMLLVMGRDDLDWWKGNPSVKSHSKEILTEAEIQARLLTEELKERFKDRSWYKYIGYETVESTLCCFKNCFHGRRYPNIYTDMSYARIKKAEKLWGNQIDFSIFWKIREEKLPAKLLLEKNPQDPGLCPKKQEFFKETGSFPMLSVLDPVFSGLWDETFYGKKRRTLF